MNSLDGFAFALGALCMFCLALIVALAVSWSLGLALFGWAKKHMSGFDEFGASREDGKVSLGAQLIDVARKRPTAKRKSPPAAKPNGHGREHLS